MIPDVPDFRIAAYEFADYRLEAAGRSLTRQGEAIPLPPKAIEVLLELVRRALDQELIVTAPRRGYRLRARVRTVELPCQIGSVAVLPLLNLSGDPAEEYFADGVTEALITSLAGIRWKGTRC